MSPDSGNEAANAGCTACRRKGRACEDGKVIESAYVLGIDIGGTNFRFGLVDENNQLRDYEQVGTQRVFGGGKEALDCLETAVREYCVKHLQERMPGAVSIGFPSTINRERTVVLQTPNIDAIPDHFPVVERLRERLGIPVFINRDVNNLLHFDLYDQHIESYGTVCGIYFGTGIGNAVMVDGKILIGAHGVASELGHLPVYGNTRICACGNESCLETLISGVALKKLQEEKFPETPISDLFTEHAGAPELRQFVRGMAQAAAAEENLFDPDCLVIGGGLVLMKDFPKEEFERAVHHFTRKPYPETEIEIRYARPNQNNGVIGAGIYAHKCQEGQKQ